MYIKKITLKNFRNYENETIDFANGLNVVIGKNAMGKTNLLESIYCCGIGKSSKTTKYKELIKWNCEYAYIKLELVKKYRNHVIEYVIDNKDKKRVKVDGIPLTRLLDLLGYLNVIYFSPDEIKLIKDSPQERRRFIDISLSQQSKTYLYSLSRYEDILNQRNKVLKIYSNSKDLKGMVESYNPQLAKEGAYIISKRYEFIEKLKGIANTIHSKLTSDTESLNLKYESKIKKDELSKMQEEFENILRNNFEKDFSLQYTQIGPHRDDLEIRVNNIDVRKFGSQGQQRTSAISLKLAEIKLFDNEVGESPVLLLDDVLSELDKDRREMLMKLSQENQTIITCTDFDMNLEHNEIVIQNGKRLN